MGREQGARGTRKRDRPGASSQNERPNSPVLPGPGTPGANPGAPTGPGTATPGVPAPSAPLPTGAGLPGGGRGPTTGPLGPAGPVAIAPVTPSSVVSFDHKQWWPWWSYNHPLYLHFDRSLTRSGPITGDSGVLPIQRSKRPGIRWQAVYGRVVPELVASLEGESDERVVRQILLALGRIADRREMSRDVGIAAGLNQLDAPPTLTDPHRPWGLRDPRHVLSWKRGP